MRSRMMLLLSRWHERQMAMQQRRKRERARQHTRDVSLGISRASHLWPSLRGHLHDGVADIQRSLID